MKEEKEDKTEPMDNNENEGHQQEEWGNLIHQLSSLQLRRNTHDRAEHPMKLEIICKWKTNLRTN